MNKDQITAWAREAGIRDFTCGGSYDSLERFAALVAVAERDVCARVAEDKGIVWKSRFDINPDNAERAYMASQFIATAIRARGQE